MKKQIQQIAFLFILLISSSATSQKTSIILKPEEILKIKINSLDIFKLNYPQEDFSNLKELGTPNRIIEEDYFVEQIKILEYPGLVLKYTNVNGSFQLMSMDINPDECKYQIVYQKINLKMGFKLDTVFNGTNSSMKNLKSDELSKNRFVEGYSFMEFIFDEETHKITKVSYKSKI